MNKRFKKMLLFLTSFLIIVGVVMLFLPSIALAVEEPAEPTCDGATWNTNETGSSVIVSGGIITAIKIKAGDELSPAITTNGNYGHNVLDSSLPAGGCAGVVFGDKFVLSGSAPAGYTWYGYYGVSGIGSNSVTVTTNKPNPECLLKDVSHLLYICTGDSTTTTDPGTTTTTAATTTTTAATTTTTAATTTTTAATTTTTAATTTTTQPTTTTTQPTTTTTAATTTTTQPTTTTTQPTTTTTGGTTTTTARRTTTTTQPTTTTGTIEVLAFTGYNSLWYVAGSILIALGIIMGTFSLSTALRKR